TDSALFTRIVTVPSSRWAMQVAQLPCSHENGGVRAPRPPAAGKGSPALETSGGSRGSGRAAEEAGAATAAAAGGRAGGGDRPMDTLSDGTRSVESPAATVSM